MSRPTRKGRSILAFCALAALTALSSVTAQAKSQLDIGAGIFAVTLPHYPGADQNKSYVLPMPYIYYRSDELELESNQLTGFLWSSDQWHLDFSAGGHIAVDSDDNRARTNMPDLDWVLELGPSLKYYLIGSPESSEQWFGEFFTRKAIATDFTSISNAGWQIGPSMTYQQQFLSHSTGYLELTVRGSVNYADSKYLNYYYGVPSAYATAQRQTFDNTSGYAGSSLSVGMTYKNKSIWTGGFVRYHSLAGTQLADSPLVFKQDNWSVGFGVVWIFYSKSKS